MVRSERCAAARKRVLAALVFVLVATTAGARACAVPASAAAPVAVYYVAMGDSLASGFGVAAADGYVARVYQDERTRFAGLQLKNFACRSATTQTVLNGPGCGTGSQLGRVTSFLRAHAGHVAFVTIDIGINDVPRLTSPDVTKAVTVPAAIGVRLARILVGIKAAYPGVKVYGMNYYDPVLAFWLDGGPGRAAARQSATVVAKTFDPLLSTTYGAAGFATADVSGRFRTTDFTRTGRYRGRKVPKNVANVCELTRVCADRADIHPNARGHAVIAQAFEAVIDKAR